MKHKQLLFSNLVFHNGINVTVRNGYKWADSLGEIVEVNDAELTQEPQMAHVLGVLTTQLNKIPESILAEEHDPSCRDLKGIMTEMQRIYGDIADDAPVTVLFFELGEESEFEIEIDDHVDVEIDMTDKEFIRAAGMAHRRDLTLNEFVNEVLEDFITEYKEEHENGTNND